MSLTGNTPYKNDCCSDAGTAQASSAIERNIFRQQLRSTAILTTLVIVTSTDRV